MLPYITYHMLLAFELFTGLLSQVGGQDVATWAAHTSCQVSTIHARLPSHWYNIQDQYLERQNMCNISHELRSHSS
ncbi:Claudin-15 [Gossypium arboreum]|uniref:Claudin-15 n=1 Tax=Gossypium arboreum TaxID=29729 RepID=A0A0B0NW49_GOSAR|nr:Claudin-15 [Gossypium arboreum]KHG26658.1 Claudin-15 [Gossypium arboreum]